jgi:cold shock CspA family protein
METQKGIIIRILTGRGFGFIRQEDGTDIFFHAVGCVSPFETLREGMEVEYMVVTNTKKNKQRAIGVVTT